MNRWRGMRVTWYLKLHGCKVGHGLKATKMPVFRAIPKGNITIGHLVNLGHQAVLEVTESGHLSIGHGCDFSHNVLISVNQEVVIGDQVLVGENASIRDSNHRVDGNKPIIEQPCDSSPVTIGSDVWIGAGTVVLAGSQIPREQYLELMQWLRLVVNSKPMPFMLGHPPDL